MAHELTIRDDNKVEMAYVGEVPWHGLGQEMAPNATVDDWKHGAGMDWTVESSRVVYRARGSNKACVLNDSVVLHRSDTDAALGIVSSAYQIVQPAEVLEFFRDLVHSIGLELNSAGTMFGGKRYFASAKIGEQSILDHDKIKGYLLLTTSADGSLKTRGKFTSVRTVCNNTLSMALRGANTGGEVAISHRSVFDPAAAKESLGIAPRTFDTFMDSMRSLTTKRLSSDMAETMTSKLVKDDKKANRSIMALFNGDAKGSNMAGVRSTPWQWLNSVTEYVDHNMRAKSDSHRLNNNLFGTGDGIKNTAREMALDYVG
jgi:phage/plasmid-like protein (TIGR03299 family)